MRAEDAHATLDLFLRFLDEGVFRISDANTRAVLFEASGLDGDRAKLEKLRGAHALTAWLTRISGWAGTDLRYPVDSVDDRDADTAELLAAAIEGRSPISVSMSPGDRVSIVFSREDALAALEGWRAGALTFSGERTAPFVLFGIAISPESLGGVQLHFVRSVPHETLDALSQRVNATPEHNTIQVRIQCERMVYEFRRLPPDAYAGSATNSEG